MAATAGQARQDDQRDNLGNHYGPAAEGKAEVRNTGKRLTAIADPASERRDSYVRSYKHVLPARRQNRFAVNREEPPPDFDLV
jgi:hypothetical protein